jgi:hypothetical protein
MPDASYQATLQPFTLDMKDDQVRGERGHGVEEADHGE